jgi:integrase
MTKRRSRGDGGLHWDETRQRWIATASLGYAPDGKRIVRRASAKTKTGAKEKLKEILRDLDDGLTIAPHGYTVKDAVTSWLTFGLNGRDEGTVRNYRCLAGGNILPHLGGRRLRDLSSNDVDAWLARMAETLSTRTLRLLHSILNRSVRHAQARAPLQRNVVMLCEIPTGRPGRPSKALTLEQAEAVLNAAEDSPLCAYIVLSLLLGARTEELRALTWDHVDLVGQAHADPEVLPSIAVWRSVRAGGDTKTRRSRRTLALPARCITALQLHHAHQASARALAGQKWQEHHLVFTSAVGTALDAHQVQRAFRKVVKAAGLVPAEWTPRELRHSFVSLLSASGMALEDIARLVGHSGTAVTESVYRKQIRPVIEQGATAMNRIFPAR